MDSPSGFPKLTWAQPGGHMPHYPFSINELYVKADAHVSLLRRIILRALMATGAWVEAGERLAIINDPLGENPCEVTNSLNGAIHWQDQLAPGVRR